MGNSMIGRAVRREFSIRGSAMLVSLLAIASPVVAQTPGAVTGVVDVAGPDKKPFVVPGVTLTLTCPATAGATLPNVRVAVTDADGAYRIQEVAPGSCSIVAELQGFQSTTTTVTIEEDRTADVALRLGFNTLREDVTVIANAATAPKTSGPSSARLDHATLQTAPIADECFQDALPLVPGVVRGPDGLLNINGSRSNQAGLTLNNASGTDPVTGEFALEVPITRFDWKAADSHQVSWLGVVSPRTQRNTFNPQRVTPSLDTDGTLFTIGDQILAHGNGVIDVRLKQSIAAGRPRRAALRR